MFRRPDLFPRRVAAPRSRLRLAALALLATVACDQQPTAPSASTADQLTPRNAITPGAMTIYKDRAAWEAAVATAGSSATLFDFAGLTLGRVTALNTNYGPFSIIIDKVSATATSNPGIDIFPDAGCSLGVGDCDVFTFNMISPSSLLDMPKVNQLVMPQPIIAFGGDFIQVGRTVPPPGSATGPVTLRFGNQSFVLNDSLDANGNGFLGFVAVAPNDTITFTFAQSASLQNDAFQVYNPAYGLAPTAPPPTAVEGITNLETTIDGFALPKGIESSLDSKLNLALAALNANNTPLACSYLQDAINFTTAQSGKKLSVSQANMIISSLADIRTQLDC